MYILHYVGVNIHIHIHLYMYDKIFFLKRERQIQNLAH